MNGFIIENEVKIGLTNMEEFKRLIDQAGKDIKQLQDTISRLERFNLNVKFDFESISAE